MTLAKTGDLVPPLRAEAIKAWRPALIAIVVACAVFAVAFSEEIVGAYNVWIGSTAYNHCFLVLPLIAVLLWKRRTWLLIARPKPSPRFLVLIPFLSIAWLIAAFLGFQEGQQLVAVALFEIFLAVILGWRVFYSLLAPLLFLFFLVPFGEFTVPTLQRFTASFTVHGLELFHIPVFADGFIIQIPEGVFEVAEACAGLRFLIASIVFGCFFATIIYRSSRRRIIFIALSIIVPIIANGMRALGLLVLAHVIGSATAVYTDHILYGWIFFSIVTILLIIIGMAFAEQEIRPAPDGLPGERSSSPLIGVTGGLALLLVLLGPAYALVVDHSAAQPPMGLSIEPSDGWVAAPYADPDWQPTVSGAAHQVAATFVKNGSSVTVFTALYRLPSRRSQLTKSENVIADQRFWRIAPRNRETLSGSGTHIGVNAAVISRFSQHRLVWWFYVVDEEVTPSTLVAKLLQLRTALSGGPHRGALVAISTESGEGLDAAEALLTEFLEHSAFGHKIRPARFGA